MEPLSFPINATTNKPYRGINLWSLSAAATLSKFQDHRWLTKKQAAKKGGGVLKGEDSTPIIFWKVLYSPEKMPVGKPKSIPFMREYGLFNVEQTAGCDFPELAISIGST